jgi:hypothetical protein
MEIKTATGNYLYVDDAAGDSGNWGSWTITFTDPPAVCFPISLTGQPPMQPYVQEEMDHLL